MSRAIASVGVCSMDYSSMGMVNSVLALWKVVGIDIAMVLSLIGSFCSIVIKNVLT